MKRRLVAGVDSSTQSLAFAIWEKSLEAYGKVVFEHTSKNIYDKAGVIGKRSGASLSKLIEVYKIKNMVIEKPIFANSPMTASNLALAQGALVGASIFAGIEEVIGVEPITWAAHIGNANDQSSNGKLCTRSPGALRLEMAEQFQADLWRLDLPGRDLQPVRYFHLGPGDHQAITAHLTFYDCK